MSAETKKQLLVGYFLFSGLIALTTYGNWWPIHLIGWISDPVFKGLVFLIFLGLLPGLAAAYIVGYGLIIAFYLVIVLVLAPFWLMISLASLGFGGLLLGIACAAGLVWFEIRMCLAHRDEWLHEGAEYLRTLVEFFAWLAYLRDSVMHYFGRTPEAERSVQTGSAIEVMEEPVQTNSFQIVRAEIVRLQDSYPELPTPPRSYHQNEYGGWFAEARKRYELEHFNRTQAQRAEVLKKIAEINGLYLTILRQEGEKQTLEQELEIRRKRLNLEELQVDGQTEDLQYEREQKRLERSRAKEPAPTPVPRKKPDLVSEITSQLEHAVRTERGVREVFRKYREQSPDLQDWLEEWEARELFDLRERKWS